jgi:hypothetical protein
MRYRGQGITLSWKLPVDLPWRARVTVSWVRASERSSKRDLGTPTQLTPTLASSQLTAVVIAKTQRSITPHKWGADAARRFKPPASRAYNVSHVVVAETSRTVWTARQIILSRDTLGTVLSLFCRNWIGPWISALYADYFMCGSIRIPRNSLQMHRLSGARMCLPTIPMSVLLGNSLQCWASDTQFPGSAWVPTCQGLLRYTAWVAPIQVLNWPILGRYLSTQVFWSCEILLSTICFKSLLKEFLLYSLNNTYY